MFLYPDDVCSESTYWCKVERLHHSIIRSSLLKKSYAMCLSFLLLGHSFICPIEVCSGWISTIDT